ncbi:kinase-like protein [Laetiporus sulphureus 93-53]|uniref:Kinase-like protein n=1 Tax=Laetiporus sulphureus 93-53 TaxID=1314785 RepID=A0A165EA94_9APHY|nr:kinase-like protein [Laetiporus sulphureus 93-53]KZT06579.1 kinase-like protein [Laetiporus sulphureus 93-53]
MLSLHSLNSLPLYGRLIGCKKEIELTRDKVTIGKHGPLCDVVVVDDDNNDIVFRGKVDSKKLDHGEATVLKSETMFSLAYDPEGMLQVTAQSFHHTYSMGCFLGRGGFGNVNKAHNQISGKLHAVKTARDPMKLTKTQLKLIKKEAAILHIVRFDELFWEDSSIYMVLEFVPMGDLSKLIERNGLNESRAQIITWQVCATLENILIVDMQLLQVKVADFGTAKIFAGTQLRMNPHDRKYYTVRMHLLPVSVSADASPWLSLMHQVALLEVDMLLHSIHEMFSIPKHVGTIDNMLGLTEGNSSLKIPSLTILHTPFGMKAGLNIGLHKMDWAGVKLRRMTNLKQKSLGMPAFLHHQL